LFFGSKTIVSKYLSFFIISVTYVLSHYIEAAAQGILPRQKCFYPGEQLSKIPLSDVSGEKKDKQRRKRGIQQIIYNAGIRYASRSDIEADPPRQKK